MKLLVFADQVYWTEGENHSTDEAYILFPLAFGGAFQSLVFLGRQAPSRERRAFAVQGHNVHFQALPFYDNLYQLWRSRPGLLSEMDDAIRAAVSICDVAWICGPNPVAHRLARCCIGMRKPFFLVIRENLVQIMAAKHRGIKRLMAMAMAWHQQRQFKRLAHERTAFVVGKQMAAVYQKATSRVHIHYPSLLTRSQISEYEILSGPPPERRLLGVGRLSAEKGYDVLLTAMAQLERQRLGCELDLVGSGPEEKALKKRCQELGLNHRVRFHGYVTFGPKLLSHYTKSSALVVPSLSEGFPQVICEALNLGLPAIASAVGGIPSVLKHGETGLLVPPQNPYALADAIRQLLSSAELWRKINRNGREQMRGFTLENQRSQMLKVIQTEVLGGSATGRRCGAGTTLLSDS